MDKENIIEVITGRDDDRYQEFKELLKAADLTCTATFQQYVKEVDFRTYIGSGKVKEIASYAQQQKADAICFDTDLTALQIRNLENILQIPVIDREDLILEIFYRRASSKTAKLQIELARLQKLLPRLIGANTQLSRQSGGRNKGAGEKQLELDRRRIKARITELKKELWQIKKERSTQRRQRRKTELPLAALVGYTNAGKSTLMNMLLNMSEQQNKKPVMAKDMLFATLDTSVRRIRLKDCPDFLLSDTVGFVSDLPHHLIEAFSSTLEEVTYADVLIQVVDAGNKHHDMQMETTKQALAHIKASHIPMITVYNKCDLTSFSYPNAYDDQLYMSTLQQAGTEELIRMIAQHLFPNTKLYPMHFPYKHTDQFAKFLKTHKVRQIQQEEDGICCHAFLHQKELAAYQPFILEHPEML